MDGLRKQKTISRILTSYIGQFAIAIIGIAFLLLVLLNTIVSYNWLRPANYEEQRIVALKDTIKKNGVLKTEIPKNIPYAIFNKNGKAVRSNVDKEEQGRMWRLHNKSEISHGSYYYKIYQMDQYVCCFAYHIGMQFSNPSIRRWIPNPELFFFLLLGASFVVGIILLVHKVANRMQQEFDLVKKTISSIKTEDLSYQGKASGIEEIQEILDTFDDMRERLKLSMMRQWRMEEERKEQIQALAHDIKTPLTVLRGNLELLDETELDEEQKDYEDSALGSLSNMEHYLQSLLDLMKADSQLTLSKKPIEVGTLYDRLKLEWSTIMDKEHIQLQTKIEESLQLVTDETILNRVLNNLIDNSVNYTKENGKIILLAKREDDKIILAVHDSGCGFTKELLEHGMEQFYQGDSSRKSRAHYGIGLYIVKQFVKQLGGEVTLGQSELLHGAKVMLTFHQIDYYNDKEEHYDRSK